MLKIYTEKPDDCVRSVDSFFSAYGELPDDDFVRGVIRDIEKGEYVNKGAFMSRSEMLLPAYNMSTGAKTLICIHMYPDRCFSLIGCGENALGYLNRLSEGRVYWKYPLYTDAYEDFGHKVEWVDRGEVFDCLEDFEERVSFIEKGGDLEM